jgi:hypothetical protein
MQGTHPRPPAVAALQGDADIGTYLADSERVTGSDAAASEEEEEANAADLLRAIQLCREFFSCLDGSADEDTRLAALEAGEQLLAMSLDQCACAALHAAGVCVDVCEAVVTGYVASAAATSASASGGGGEDPTAACMAAGVLANMCEHGFCPDLSAMLLRCLDGEQAPDASFLRVLFRLITNVVGECTLDIGPPIGAPWVAAIIPATARVLNMVLVTALDPMLLSTSWSCVYMLLACDDYTITDSFAANWDGILCIRQSLEPDSYVILIQGGSESESSDGTAFKWLLAVVDILEYRSFFIPSMHRLWHERQSGPAAAPTYSSEQSLETDTGGPSRSPSRDLIVARLLDLSLAIHWGFSIMQKSDDQISHSLSDDDSFLLSSVLGRLITHYLSTLDCYNKSNSNAVQNFLVGSISILLSTHVCVLEEALLRLDQGTVMGVLVVVNSLWRAARVVMNLPNCGNCDIRDFYFTIYGRKNCALKSIAYLFNSTDILKILAIGDQGDILLMQAATFSELVVIVHTQVFNAMNRTYVGESLLIDTQIDKHDCVLPIFENISVRLTTGADAPYTEECTTVTIEDRP